MTRPDDSFSRGALTGVAGSAVLAQGWLGVKLEPLREMYTLFGADIPALTSLMISPLWLVGVPIVGLLAVAALAVRRPRGALAYWIVAATVVLLVVATWHFAQAPIFERANLVQ